MLYKIPVPTNKLIQQNSTNTNKNRRKGWDKIALYYTYIFKQKNTRKIYTKGV